jgi:lipid-binding SYLF domain-containing protein
MRRILFLSLFAMLLAVPLARATDATDVNLKPRTPKEWRTYLNFRREETLENLYKLKPEAKSVIENAQGYAVFSNFGMKLGVFGGGSGRGVMHDNKSGRETFMRMVQGGVGWGLGVKDFRAVFVFDNRDVMEKFISSGWSFGSQANASAKTEEAGATTAGAIVVAPGVRVYQMTENGLALEIMVQGTKYWVDASVNGKEEKEKIK